MNFTTLWGFVHKYDNSNFRSFFTKDKLLIYLCKHELISLNLSRFKGLRFQKALSNKTVFGVFLIFWVFLITRSFFNCSNI